MTNLFTSKKHAATILAMIAMTAVGSTYSMAPKGFTPYARDVQKRSSFFCHIMGHREDIFRKTYGWQDGKVTLEAKAINDLKKPGSLGQAVFANGPFSSQSVQDLDQKIGKPASMGKPQFNIAIYDPNNPHETDILYLQSHPANKGTAFQLASTFFGPLEGGMAHWEHRLEDMLKHAVQGENASIGAAPATIWRKYFMGKIYYALYYLKNKAPLLKSKRHLFKIDFTKLKQYHYDSSDIKKISIGTHKEVIISTGYGPGSTAHDLQDQIHIAFDKKGMIDPKKCQTVTQIFTAAYPMNYALKHGEYYNSNVQDFAKMVLDGMYEGTVKASYNAGCKNLVLTMLGGGAFRNRLSWIAHALNRKEFKQFIKDAGLSVTFIYRPDKYRHEDATNGYPMRDAQEDIAFFGELLKLSDDINGTNHANDQEIQKLVTMYITNAYTVSKNPRDSDSLHDYRWTAECLKALIN